MRRKIEILNSKKDKTDNDSIEKQSPQIPDFIKSSFLKSFIISFMFIIGPLVVSLMVSPHSIVYFVVGGVFIFLYYNYDLLCKYLCFKQDKVVVLKGSIINIKKNGIGRKESKFYLEDESGNVFCFNQINSSCKIGTKAYAYVYSELPFNETEDGIELESILFLKLGQTHESPKHIKNISDFINK